MDAQDRPALFVDWRGQKATVAVDAARPLCLGAGDGMDIQVPRTFASRNHLSIHREQHAFVLEDHSSNGTYVQTEDERVHYVHRTRLRLWGNGWISLGEPLTEDSAIRFRHG